MASNLMRWDPFAELQTFRSAMDRQFEQLFGRVAPGRNGEDLASHSLGLDVVESNDAFVVRAAIPGIDPKDVEININDDVLTIAGEVHAEEEQKDQTYVRRELRWGSFQRSLKLPPTIDAEKASAKFEHGMLELSLPKRPEARSRSLKITPQGVIEAATETQQPAN